MRITKKTFLMMLPFLIALFICNRSIFAFLSSLIKNLYLGSVQETGAYTMLILFVLFTVFCFLIPDEDQLDNTTMGMRNFLLLSLVIQMFAPLNNLAMRMNYYYIIFIPLLIPKIIRKSAKKYHQIAVVSQYVMIVFFCLYFFLEAPRVNSLDIFPYHFFWENIP